MRLLWDHPPMDRTTPLVDRAALQGPNGRALDVDLRVRGQCLLPWMERLQPRGNHRASSLRSEAMPRPTSPAGRLGGAQWGLLLGWIRGLGRCHW